MATRRPSGPSGIAAAGVAVAARTPWRWGCLSECLSECVTVCLSVCLAGCQCGPEPELPRQRPPGSEVANTHGEESSLAIAYDGVESAPTANSFDVVAGEEAPMAVAQATRAGGWAALRRGGPERQSVGNFLCRLETLYGRALVVGPEQVAFVLRDLESGIVITAVADPRGPWFGALVPATPTGEPLARASDPHPDPSGDPSRTRTEAAQTVLALATLLDATVPRSCRYSLAGRDVGVEDGRYF